jgi:hypothetical protein
MNQLSFRGSLLHTAGRRCYDVQAGYKNQSFISSHALLTHAQQQKRKADDRFIGRPLSSKLKHNEIILRALFMDC